MVLTKTSSSHLIVIGYSNGFHSKTLTPEGQNGNSRDSKQKCEFEEDFNRDTKDPEREMKAYFLSNFPQNTYALNVIWGLAALSLLYILKLLSLMPTFSALCICLQWTATQ